MMTILKLIFFLAVVTSNKRSMSIRIPVHKWRSSWTVLHFNWQLNYIVSTATMLAWESSETEKNLYHGPIDESDSEDILDRSWHAV